MTDRDSLIRSYMAGLKSHQEIEQKNKKSKLLEIFNKRLLYYFPQKHPLIFIYSET